MRTGSTRHWRIAVLAVFCASVFLRMILSARLGLGDDEAYYWDWSRRLELSYYDHPAMTAWMIKSATLVFGQNPFAVRFFANICNFASAAILWRLGRKLFGDPAALIGVSLYLVAPIFSLGGMLMVPDAPMGMAWMAFMLLIWRIIAEEQDGWETWLLAGAVLGFGLLSKYTIILSAVSVLLFFAADPSGRRQFMRVRLWAAAVLSAAFCLPIVIWNATQDWPTLKYHLHDRQTGGGGMNMGRWGQFFASQAIALGPALFVLCLITWIIALRRWRDRRWKFVFFMTLPTFALFCAQALFAEFKPHWPAPAYTLMFVAIGELAREGFGVKSERARLVVRSAIAFLVLMVVVPLNVIFYVGTLHPIIPKIARQVAPAAPWDAKFDPTNDLYGWPAAVAAAEEIRKAYRTRGEPEPFLSSSRYQLVAQIAFIAGERVWRVSPGSDQYSFWQKPDEWQPLLGRDSIYITDNRYERDPRGDLVFEDCEPRSPVVFYRDGEFARRFNVWLCRRFLGLR